MTCSNAVHNNGDDRDAALRGVGQVKMTLGRDIAAICSTMHPSTEAQGTTAISTSVHLSGINGNSATTHTQSITMGVLSTAWSICGTRPPTRPTPGTLGRNASTTANAWYCKPRRQSDGKWVSISEWHWKGCHYGSGQWYTTFEGYWIRMFRRCFKPSIKWQSARRLTRLREPALQARARWELRLPQARTTNPSFISEATNNQKITGLSGLMGDHKRPLWTVQADGRG